LLTSVKSPTFANHGKKNKGCYETSKTRVEGHCHHEQFLWAKWVRTGSMQNHRTRTGWQICVTTDLPELYLKQCGNDTASWETNVSRKPGLSRSSCTIGSDKKKYEGQGQSCVGWLGRLSCRTALSLPHW
jgi:hypothetical protein